MRMRVEARMRKDVRHLVETGVERACTLAYGDGCNRKLVERHGGDGSGFGEPRPDKGEHDDHQGAG